MRTGYNYNVLDTCYRCHPSLLQVPNKLFYDDMIRSGYQFHDEKRFLFSHNPFLFIDVPRGREQNKGTSFCNFQEVDEVVNIINHIIGVFDKNQGDNGLPKQKFSKGSICIITAYNAQKMAIK